jgi:hypothetical protein
MEQNKITKKTIQFFKGFSLGTVVFLILFVMKIFMIGDVANWSWWLVTLPLWIAPALAIGFFLLWGIAIFVLGLLGALLER